jgi:phytoene/squalene synthetase
MQTNMDIERLGAVITRGASLQTYYTVRFLVDRPLVPAAYRAYAYFRWVDDWLDEPTRQRAERLGFLKRQTRLIEASYCGETVSLLAPQEAMVVQLIRQDGRQAGGLHAYIRNMMAVMAFDAQRRGRLISQSELNHYQRSLAVAVTEALHHFIGHNSAAPHGSTRYLAAEGAHIAHMLRDTLEDNRLGYFNIPYEYVKAKGISPQDIDSEAHRAWVRRRVELARSCFRAGRSYLSQVQSLRCRLAGYAYIARFETVLDTIERDGYLLREEYRESRGAMAGVLMGWSVLYSAFNNNQRPAVGSGAAVAR